MSSSFRSLSSYPSILVLLLAVSTTPSVLLLFLSSSSSSFLSSPSHTFTTHAFTPPLMLFGVRRRQQQQRRRTNVRNHGGLHRLATDTSSTESSSFMDVEFERVQQENDDNREQVVTPSSTEGCVEDNVPKQQSQQQQQQEEATHRHWSSKSLLDYSLDLDPQWKNVRIPFTSTTDNQYIDCQLCFTIDLHNTTYGIGIPSDPAVAIVMEDNNNDDDDDRNTVTYMNPVEYDELVEIMAGQLHDLVGKDIFLKRTPKILTITGNLGKYVPTGTTTNDNDNENDDDNNKTNNNWKDNLFNETMVVGTEQLLDDVDEGLDFFYNFMRDELGDDEFQRTLQEARTDGGQNTIDGDLLDLFNVPGLGDQANDVEGIQELLDSMANDVANNGADVDELFTKLGDDLEHDGVALKLIGFNFRDGKSYSLVKLLKPFTIVGRYVGGGDGEEDDLRFDLLTPEEEKILIPRLEQVCRKDLEEAGLSLQ